MMVKKLTVVIALALTLAIASPVGEARAVANTVSAQAEAHAQAEADFVASYGPYLENTPGAMDALMVSGLRGWFMCIAAVTFWVGTNALVAAKAISLIKRAGSIKAAITRIMRMIEHLPMAKRHTVIIASLVSVAGDILGLDAVIDKCFDS